MNKLNSTKRVKQGKTSLNEFKELERKYYSNLYQSNQEFEKDPYNKTQNNLYKQALYGLKNYSEKELKEMSIQKRKKIQLANLKAQKELNILKQKKIINITNKILGMFNKDNTLANIIINQYSEPTPHFFCTMSLKDLKIDKESVVNTFINKKILPNNFKTL